MNKYRLQNTLKNIQYIIWFQKEHCAHASDRAVCWACAFAPSVSGNVIEKKLRFLMKKVVIWAVITILLQNLHRVSLSSYYQKSTIICLVTRSWPWFLARFRWGLSQKQGGGGWNPYKLCVTLYPTPESAEHHQKHENKLTMTTSDGKKTRKKNINF